MNKLLNKTLNTKLHSTLLSEPDEQIIKKFFTDTDSSGRFMVISKRTGKRYFVEPMGNPHTNWGDVDPATKKTTGSYGQKYRGSIDEKDSLITSENGFKNIIVLEKGMSPLAYIDKLDNQYPDKTV
jgi:hypothetical protein